MNFEELSRTRYSVRTYLSKNVEKEKLDYILECARLAPSACNNQPWFFYIVTSDEVRRGVQESYNREWFKTAPLYIVVCGNHNQSWKRTNTDQKDYCDVDTAIVAEHICLATHDAGLGTCWVCNFDPRKLAQALHLPDHLEAIAIFPLGYIDEAKSLIPEKKRKQLTEVSQWV